MPYPLGLETVQYAREAVAGTDLATTSKLISDSVQFMPASPDMYRPRISRGLLLANRGGEAVVQRSSQFTLAGPLTYEQAHMLFNGVVQNVASPTGAGPYVWLAVRNPANIPSLASYTFERRETDSATPIDHAFHYAMFSSLDLTFAANDVWKYSISGFARRVQTETLTAAITLPSHEVCVVPGTKVYIDSTWAGLGTTQVVAQVLSGSIRLGSGALPKWTADGRTDYDYTTHVFNDEQITCEISLTLLLGAQFAIEKTAAEAGTLRAVRIQIDSGATRQIQIDALCKYRVPELYGFTVDDGQVITTLELVGSTDATNAWQTKVTNNVATFI